MEENPIETFLFDTRAGFCGHYATAFVYLMRVAGIPARVVGGCNIACVVIYIGTNLIFGTLMR
jgi:transglutaminase-like putative cysteine protease